MEEERTLYSTPRDKAALWLGALAPPVIWLTLLQINYMSAFWVCRHQLRWLLWVYGLLALLLALASGIPSWRRWRQRNRTAVDETGAVAERGEFMALGGALNALFFGIAIVLTTIPAMVHRACD
jgi:hypothetical protein